MSSPVTLIPAAAGGTPPASAPVAGEPGEFARRLEQAASDSADGADRPDDAADPATETPRPAPANAARGRLRAETKAIDRAPAQRTPRSDDGIETRPDKPSRQADPNAKAPTDLPAWLAGLMAPAPAPAQGPAAEARGAGDPKATAEIEVRGAVPEPRAAETVIQPAHVAAMPMVQPEFELKPAPAVAEPAAQVHEAQIGAAVGTPEFAPGLAAEVKLMLHEGLPEARLQLNPAEMGPITVQIQIDGGNARIHLTAEQAPTRDALEQALPMLAGALHENGLTLTGGGVSEQPRPPRDDAPAPPSHGAKGTSGEAGPSGPVRHLSPRGVVDLYA